MESRHEKRAIGIATPSEMRERLVAAARGEDPPVTAEAKVWMSLETLVRLLTSENRKLLSIMAQERPRSVSALAERAGRDQGNVSRAIGRLAEAGFVRLVPDGREKRPEVAIERLHIDLDLVNDRLAIARSRPAGPGDPDTADRRQSA
jgi:predicted transcriptional regulator